jgi:copper chaperone
MSRITLDVPGISCGHCKLTIERAARDVAGVTTAQVHVKEHCVDVEFDDSTVDRATIVSAIEAQGYEVTAD